MPDRCPVCDQVLPANLTQEKLQQRVVKLASPALNEEKRRLKEEFEVQLAAQSEIARQRAEREASREVKAAQKRVKDVEDEKLRDVRKLKDEFEQRAASERAVAEREAERKFNQQLKDANKRAKEAEQSALQKIERARREERERMRVEVGNAVSAATQKTESQLDRLQVDREKDKLRFEAERARFQTQVDLLSRKLEKQSGEQFGEEAEVDLAVQLANAFPGDRIERIGRGKKGADIVQHVNDGSKCMGKIVYESKNVASWQHAFISQAKRYQVQYETPHVMIVSRVFPSKEKDLCIFKGIPVVSPKMSVALATMIRRGVIDIGRLKVTDVGRNEKGEQLFDYIISDKFSTRFRELAEGIAALRDNQQKERDWHERTWHSESKLHEQIGNRHREIDAHLTTIVKNDGVRKKIAMAARA